MAQLTAGGIAYERAGPRGGRPLVLVHAGIADRRMWDAQWPSLALERDAVRLDLRGFGESTAQPEGSLSPVEDVLATVSWLGIERCDLVGASFGAGVAVEAALLAPALVASLLLVAPGGSLIAEMSADLRAFFDAEGAALEAGEVDAAVEANLAAWVDGRDRGAGEVEERVRAGIGAMQRRAFEITTRWGEVEEDEVDPPALERLDEVTAPTLVLLGALDLDVIHDAASRVVADVAGARRVDWPDVAHLPSMEHPEDFLTLLREWLTEPDLRD